MIRAEYWQWWAARTEENTAVSRQQPVQVRRAYDLPQADDGARVLVDRLWPRGISKEKAHFTEWCKEVAPSTELRKWYAHDPQRYEQFRERYLNELQSPDRAAVLGRLRELAAQGQLTLITASKAASISEAQVLADLLNEGRS